MFSSVAVVLVGATLIAAEHELCGQFQSYSSKPYVFNNDAWNADNSGSVCTYVSDDPSSSNNAFYALWQWSSEPPIVKAYPHIEVQSPLLPLQLSGLESLNVSLAWSLAPTSLAAGASQDPSTQPDASALDSNDVQANVVLDIFGDVDANTSTIPGKQGFEFMVWVAQFGDASKPIGNNAPLNPAIVADVDGIGFTLYNGTNSKGQQVFSWVSNQTVTSLNSDFAPLLGALVAKNMVSQDVYIGTVQFGTETFRAETQMNFSVSAFDATINNVSGDATTTNSPTNGVNGLPTATLIPQPTRAAAASTSVPRSLLCVTFLGLWLYA